MAARKPGRGPQKSSAKVRLTENFPSLMSFS
jgi:hypothetical protein